MLLSWIVLILEGFFCYLIKSLVSENSDTLCIAVIAINVIVVICEILCHKDDKHRKIILVFALFFRVFLLFWDLKCRSIFVLPNSGSDSEMYAESAMNGYFADYWGRGGMYAKYIAFWYRFFGVERAIAQYTNVLLSLTIIKFVIETMKYLNVDRKHQNVIVLMLTFLPNFALMNSILLRETIVMFTTAISVYFFIKWMYENKICLLVGSIIACSLGAMFHSGAIAPLLGEAVVYVLYDRKKKTLKLNKNSVISVFIVVILFLALNATVGDAIFGKFQRIDSVEDVISISDKYNQGGSAYDVGFNINNNVLNLIINTPIRMFYFVASPLPWDWRGIGDIIAFFFSAMVYLYIYWYSIKEVKRGNNKNHTMIIVLMILSLSTALIFSWGVSNAGSALRHREKFIAIYLLLLSVCKSGHTEIGSKT